MEGLSWFGDQDEVEYAEWDRLEIHHLPDEMENFNESEFEKQEQRNCTLTLG